MRPQTTIIAIDIGGTNARFAPATLGADGAITLGEAVILPPAGFASLEAAWAEACQRLGLPAPRAAALAIAADVSQPGITCANIPHWGALSRADLPRRLGLEAITLVNDFAAMGHAVTIAGPEHFRHITGPDQPLPSSGTISVVGPGTGLGVAHLWRDGQGLAHVQATEGGHIGFAPVDAIDDAILARLRPLHGRVSAERVVSGPAIVDIYATLAALAGQPAEPADAASIWRRADAGQDRLAVAAAERFCLTLGAVAGDYALAHGASAVVLAGGVAQRQAARLAAGGFAHSFCAKGRFSRNLAGLPVKLITHPQPGLLGAAAAFAREHRS